MNDNDDPAGLAGSDCAGQPDRSFSDRTDGGAGGRPDGALGRTDGGAGGRSDGGAPGLRDGAAGRSTANRPIRRGLRLLAVATVIVGVLLLAAAAFVFSYAPVHDIALSSGLRAGLARVFPLLPDAVLVVACAAALALRGARWWTRWFTWLSILVVVALVGTVDAVHAMAIKLPRRPVAASVAVLPWALLLLGLRLWLSVLRHARLEPAAATASAPGAAFVAPPSMAGTAELPPPIAGTAESAHPLAATAQSQPQVAGTASTPPPAAGQDRPLPPPAAGTASTPPISAEPAEATASHALPTEPASDVPDSAASARGPTGLDLILPPHLDEPPADGGNYADSTVDLAIDADPEPDDPASDDDEATSATCGGYQGSALPLGIEEPALKPAPGYTQAPPLLGAPVPVPDQPEQAQPDRSGGDRPELGEPELGEPELGEPELGEPEPSQPPPQAARQEPARPPHHAAPSADFQRVHSSPLPPGKSKR